MKKTLLVGLTLGLLLSGCDKDDSLNNIDGGGVRFTTYMVESRATDTAWEAGDEIGVYMQTNAASGYQNINVKYANTEGNVNSFVSENPITYSGNENTVSFMAVYPYNETVTDGNYTFTLGNDSLSKNDIMYASTPSITAGTTNVPLNFQHKLTKIALQINDADGKSVTGATVSIDKQCVNGVLNVADGAVSVADNAAYTSTLNFAESNGTYEVIVIPDEGCKGRSIVIKSDGKTYRCPVENISFGGSKKYTFPVSLQSSSTSSSGGSTEGETIIKLDALSFSIKNWTGDKSTGWIISSEAEISTENKTRKELVTNQSLSADSPVEIAPKNDMTLTATDVYCIEYSRTDAEMNAATLIVSQPATRSGAAQKTYTLPAGLANGQLVFAVGDFTNGFSVSSTVALTLDAVSVYSEESSGSEDSGETETPSQTEEIEVWTGSHNLGSWDKGTSIEYKPEILAKTTEGCTLRFYYTDKADGAQLQFAGTATIDVTGDAGYVDMEVTAELITALTGNSWPFLNGQNMTVTRIVLIGKSESGSEDSGETETPSQTEELEVWTGSHNLGSWNGASIEYKPEILAKTTEGCTLRFYYTDKTDGAQLQFAGTDTIDVTDDAGYVDMEVTAKLVAALTENSWPYLNGQNMTVTKIVLICPAEN